MFPTTRQEWNCLEKVKYQVPLLCRTHTGVENHLELSSCFFSFSSWEVKASIRNAATIAPAEFRQRQWLWRRLIPQSHLFTHSLLPLCVFGTRCHHRDSTVCILWPTKPQIGLEDEAKKQTIAIPCGKLWTEAARGPPGAHSWNMKPWLRGQRKGTSATLRTGTYFSATIILTQYDWATCSSLSLNHLFLYGPQWHNSPYGLFLSIDDSFKSLTTKGLLWGLWGGWSHLIKKKWK